MGAFVPKPKEREAKRHINMTFNVERYARVVKAAKKSKLSIREFCRQATIYGVETVEKGK